MKNTLQWISMILCILVLTLFVSCGKSDLQPVPPKEDPEKEESPALPDVMAGDGVIHAQGIDISKWQYQNVDFEEVRDAGYSFVIIRCGTSLGKDDCFDTFYEEAKAAGLYVGTYYYSYATTIEEAEADAANCLSYIEGKFFEYPVYFDFEDPTQLALDSTPQARICYPFLQKMRDADYLTGLYSMASVIEQSWVNSYRLRNMFEGWIAHYHDSGSYEQYDSVYSKKYGMSQYTDALYINGMGPYDGNVCYKDYPSIVTEKGLNGYGE